MRALGLDALRPMGFVHLHEFHNPAPNASGFVPADLPLRYAIDFVPAAPVSHTPVVFSTSASPVNFVAPVIPSASASTDYSVISSVNFVAPAVPSAPASSDFSMNFVAPNVPSASASTDYSVISSINFVACIESNT